jgi:4-diphosphocytidyl-2-C-methyl-D-erythritol kinase
MIAFPFAKINLGLHIVAKRADGYHDLETVFYPLPLTDVVEIVVQPQQDLPRLLCHGLPIPGEAKDNLCLKAWHLLKADFPHLPAVDIHLLKNIPMGGGLGGGSADASSVLQLLNQAGQLGLDKKALQSYALQLGSDCPYFLEKGAQLGKSRGEDLTPFDLDLKDFTWVLVLPPLHVSTKWAFGQISPSPAPHDWTDVLHHHPKSWRGVLTNDFEAPVVAAHPELAQLKNDLYAAGADYVSMSGSGSSFYALFSAGQFKGLPKNFTWPHKVF